MVHNSEDFPLMHVRISPYGERGYLLDGFGDMDRQWMEQVWTLDPLLAFEECVWGADNCLLLFTRPVELQVLRTWLHQLQGAGAKQSIASRCIDVNVVYDGPDLEAVAAAVGLSESEVVAIHTAPTYRVRMMGFSPGFPYLDGLDPRLHLERQASPRTRIERGSVAIGGSHAGIYSVASPGGWHLLGRTELPLFQSENARGAVCDPNAIFSLAAGDAVKFIAI